MRFALMTEPQMGLSYEDHRAIVQRAERAGFEAFFRSDHYEGFPGDAGGPTTDAWTVIAGLTRETSTINLGVLVTPVTFRAPGNLAKIVVTADEMSSGRIEVGVGAGWHEDEHRRHGFPFPEIGERAEMLEETLEILHGLWEEPDGWSFLGKHYAVEDSLFRPKPGELPARNGGRPNLITGSSGSPRAYRIAARYADEFNLSSTGPEAAASKMAAVDEACRAIGRDPSTLTRSVMVGVLLGRDRDELARRQRELMAAIGSADEDADAWFAARQPRWVLGTPDEARSVVARFAEAGVERLMLQDFIPRDLDMIDLAAEVLFDA